MDHGPIVLFLFRSYESVRTHKEYSSPQKAPSSQITSPASTKSTFLAIAASSSQASATTAATGPAPQQAAITIATTSSRYFVKDKPNRYLSTSLFHDCCALPQDVGVAGSQDGA